MQKGGATETDQEVILEPANKNLLPLISAHGARARALCNLADKH